MAGRTSNPSRKKKAGRKLKLRDCDTDQLGFDFESDPGSIPSATPFERNTKFTPSNRAFTPKSRSFGTNQTLDHSALDDVPMNPRSRVSWWRWHTLGGVDPEYALIWPVRLVLSIALILTSGISSVALVHWWAQVTQVEGFWVRPQIIFSLMGALVFFLLLAVSRRAVSTLYVFAHELTHVAFSYLTGGEVRDELHVTSSGGHVITYKANFLVTLSPYFFPAYTIVVVGTFGIASLVVNLNLEIAGVRLIEIAYLLVGMTMAMHLAFTLYMLLRGQSDVTMQGWIFSLLVIFQVNVLVVSALLGVADSGSGLRGYIREWVEVAEQCIRFSRDFISIRSATGL